MHPFYFYKSGKQTQIPSRAATFLFGLCAGASMYIFYQKQIFGYRSMIHAETDAEESAIKTQKQLQQEMLAHQKDGKKTPVYRIVLTGGPCGGKSTAMAMISNRLMSLGFRVFRVPEAATLLQTGTGLNAGKLEDQERATFEACILKTKIALEDVFYEIAKSSSHPSVVICDRGTMDSRAYMDADNWDVLLDEYSWKTVDLRERRYDAVIHLVTAAIGAEKFYTTENNATRHEGLNEARDLDFKVLNAWVGHPRIRIIDNSTDFKTKIQRVEEVICQIVGAPRPALTERKFIVSGEILPDLCDKLGIKMETFYVEQIYLQKNDPDLPGYNYLRRRGQNGIYTYTHSIVRHPAYTNNPSDSEEETSNAILERSVSGREFLTLIKTADPTKSTVIKKVQCFLWNSVYFELQTYVKPDIGLTILKTELEPGKTFSVPWFLQIKGEITGVKEFSSYCVADMYAGISNPKEKGLTWKENLDMMKAFIDKKEQTKKDRERDI
jgi:thymidylate kinase